MIRHFIKYVATIYYFSYKTLFAYCHELAPGSVSLTGDRVKGGESKQYAYSSGMMITLQINALTFYALIDFSFGFNTIKVGFQGSQIIFSK